MANTNKGRKLFVCATPQADDLTEAEFGVLDWVKVGHVGSFGESGSIDNILNYDELEADVIQKSKGLTNGGDPPIEVARKQTDPGQIILRAAGLTKYNYALKVVDDDAEPGYTNTVYYYRGRVTGPVRPGGRAEDFVLEVFTLAVNQRNVVSNSAAIPAWVLTTEVNGVTQWAKLDYDFVNKRFWLNGVVSTDPAAMIRYAMPGALMYQQADGTITASTPDVPIIETGHGMFFTRGRSVNVKYNRDLRINYRVSLTGIGGGESIIDGQAVTTVEGGSGIAIITGEGTIYGLGNWTGTAPATGHTLNITGGSCVIGSTVTPVWVHTNVTVAKNAYGVFGLVANTACTVTATAANGSVKQAVTISSAMRASHFFMRRVVDPVTVELTINGTTWDSRAIPSGYGRYVSEMVTLANPTMGFRLPTNGTSVIVDFADMVQVGPIQTELNLVSTIGKGLANLPMPTGSLGTQLSVGNMQADLFRKFPEILDDTSRGTMRTEFLNFTSEIGGNLIQVDFDGTDTATNKFLQNFSATDGSGSDGNFGVSFFGPGDPGGFGNDPQNTTDPDPKAVPNVVHSFAWSFDFNNDGNDEFRTITAVDTGNNGAHVMDEPIANAPSDLQFVRLTQWREDVPTTSGPGQGMMHGWLRRFTFFEGDADAEEVQTLANTAPTATA